MRNSSFKQQAIGLALTCVLASFKLQAAGTGMYVANGGGLNVNVIDTETLQVVGTVSVGSLPLNVAFDGITGMYVVNQGANNVSIIDTNTIQVVNTVTAGTSPRAVALDGGTGMYVANNNGGNVSIINTETQQVVGSITVGSSPGSLALDGNTGMYVANEEASGLVHVIDTQFQQLVATITVGSFPQSLAYDGVTGMYDANGGGNTVHIIDTTTLQLAGTITVGGGPRALALDSGTGMYVASQNANNVNIINTQTLQVAGTITVGTTPRGLAYDGVTGMYVANTNSNNVNLIDTQLQQIVGTVSVGVSPDGIALDSTAGLPQPPPPPPPTSATVTTNSDGVGAGTLRDAIAQVNVGGITTAISFTGGIGTISLGSDLPAFTVSDIIVSGVSSPQVISGGGSNFQAFSFPGAASLSDVNFSSTVMGNSGTLSLSTIIFDTSTVQNVGQLLVSPNEGLTCINSSVTGSGVLSLSGAVLGASGSVTVGQPLNIVSSSTAAISSGGTLAALQGLSGTGQLSKTLAGLLSLSGTSETHTGDLLIQAGDLLLTNGLSGGGNLSMQGGDLSSSTPGTFTISRSVAFFSDTNVSVPSGATLAFSGATASGTGNLTKTGSGILSLTTDTSALTGSLLVQGGTLSIGADLLGNGNLTLQGGNLFSSGTIVSRPVIFSSNADVDVLASTTLEFAAGISGSGDLTKVGDGTLSVTGGASAHSGDALIQAGTLNLGAGLSGGGNLSFQGGNLSSATVGAFTISRPAIFSSNGNVSVPTGATLTFSNSITGPAALIKTSAGSLIIDSGATALGAVVVDDGLLQLDNTNSLPAGTGTLSVNTSGRVDVNASISTGNVSSTGTIQVNTGNTLTSNVTGSTTLAGTAAGLGSLVKAGSGVWDFTADTSALTGSLLVPGGTLSVGATLSGNGDLTMQGGNLSTATPGSFTISRPAAFSSDANVSVPSGATLSFSTSITGPGALTKTSAGSLVIDAEATALGAVVVDDGVLQLDNTSSLPAGTGTLSINTSGRVDVNASVSTGNVSSTGTIQVNTGSTLTSNVTGSTTLAGTAAGLGSLVKAGSGVWDFTADTSALTGSLLVPGGTLSVGATLSGNGDLTMQGGNLSTATPGSFTISRPAAFSSDAEVSVPSGATLSFSTSITGPGTLTKTSAGSLVIDAEATALGAVVVDDGVLQLDNTNSLPAGTGTLSISTSGRVDVNASVSTGNVSSTGTIQIASGNTLTSNVLGSITLAGTASGLGSLAKSGSGQWDFTADTSALTGSLLVQGGTLSVGATLSGNGNLTMQGGDLSTGTPGAFTVSRPALFSSDGNVSIPAGATLSFSTSITGPGALTKTSPGSLVIDGEATALGAIVVDSGLLQLNNDNSLPAGTGTLSLNGSAVVDINASVSTGNVSGTGVIQIVGASNSLTASISGSASLGGTVSGLGSLGKAGAGTWIFTADTSALTGPFFVEDGIVSIGGDLFGSGDLIFQGGDLSSFGTEVSRPIILSSNADVDVATSSTLIFSGGLSGPGNLTKTGGGVLSLTGDTSFHSGNLLISDGALDLNSNVTGGGNLTFQGGSLSASQTLEVPRPILFSSNGTVDVLDLKTLTFSGTVSGANLLTKTGLGTLIITSDATSLGAISVNNGTLQVDGTASLPAAPGTVAIGVNGTLDVNASVSTGNISGSGTIQINSGNTLTTEVSGSATLAGTVTGEGTFAKGGTGTQIFSGNVTNLNTLNLADGIVEIGSSSSLPLTGTIISGASSTLSINQTMMMGILSGSGTLNVPSGVNVSSTDVGDFTGGVTGGGSLDTGGDPNDPASPITVVDGTFTVEDGRTGKITLLSGTNLEVTGGFTLLSEIDMNGTVGLIIPSGSAVLEGTLNADTMIKRGPGFIALGGTSTFNEDLTLAEGALGLNATTSVGNDIIIQSDATLRGNGVATVVGNVTSQSGAVDPGGSIGTLTIIGDYTADPGSSHIFEISPAEQSKLVVNGQVTLADPALGSVLTEIGFYQLPFSFNAIESDRTITGTLTDVSVSNPFLFATVSTSSNPGHFITITLNSVLLAPLFSGKEGAVAKCIDEIASQLDCNTNTAASALATLTTTSEVGKALLQLQPSSFTSLSVLQENHLLYLSSAVDQHLDGPSTRKTKDFGQWNLWITGIGGHTDQNNSSRDVGFIANSAGAVIGADKLLGKHSSAGTLLGYTNGHLRWREERGKADTHTVYAGGYGRFATARAFVNAALLYGYTFYDVDRRIQFGNFQPLKETAKSDFQGMEGSAHVQTGLNYQSGRFAFSPFVEADYMVIHQNKFTEHNAGALNLKVASHLADLLSTAAGLKLAYRKVNPDCSLAPFVGLKIIHEERFFGDTEEGAFVCGCSMGDLKGLYPSRTLLGVQAGLNTVFLGRHTLSLQYEGKFSHNYSDQSGYLEYSCRL